MKPRAALPLPPWLAACGPRALALSVWVVAHPRRSRVMGQSDGRLRLQLTVGHQDGHGNLAAVAFLAAQLAVPRAQVVVVVGHASWRKTVHVAGVAVVPCLLALSP